VNLDSNNIQSGFVDLDLDAVGVDRHLPYSVHDLLTDSRYTWSGGRNFVALDPNVVPAHIFRVEPVALDKALPHTPPAGGESK
jgi:starch synthase (maltosyl-transferring)